MFNDDVANGDQLHPRNRMALAYAPRQAREPRATLLLLEQRLADAAKPGRDPLMVQLRLAWWRDRLGEDAVRWPVSEQALAALRSWQGLHHSLVGLVDGWEALVVSDDGGHELAKARVAACVSLARLLGETRVDSVEAAAIQLADPVAKAHLPSALPRTMRPLAVLRAFALRDASAEPSAPLVDLARIIRAGLLGR